MFIWTQYRSSQNIITKVLFSCIWFLSDINCQLLKCVLNEMEMRLVMGRFLMFHFNYELFPVVRKMILLVKHIFFSSCSNPVFSPFHD